MIGEYKIMPVKSQMRVTGIEPAFSPWKGVVLPINYTRTINSLSVACVASVSSSGVVSSMETLLAAIAYGHAQPTVGFVLVLLAVICEVIAFLAPKWSNSTFQPLNWMALGIGFFFASFLAA